MLLEISIGVGSTSNLGLATDDEGRENAKGVEG